MSIFRLLAIIVIASIFTSVSVLAGNFPGNWTITVDATKITSEYNQLISGNNVNWINKGDGIYDSSQGKVATETAKLIQGMGISVLRFPGGTLSEYYDWKAGIGPISSRKTGLDYAKKPQKMDFGIDDFLRFCEISKILPVFTIGYLNNSPATASEIVEYCNGSTSTKFGSLRAMNGHQSPYKVQYWEIGNEIYTAGITAEKAKAYGKKVHNIAVMMKIIDPTIKIGAIGLGLGHIWDDNVLKECANDIDFVVYHRYFPNTWSNDADATNNAVVAASVKLINEVKQLQANAIKYNPKISVAVTEYNLHFRDANGNFINKSSDVQQALFIAECMRLFQINSVLFATKWNLSHSNKHYFSDINFNGGTKTTLSPSYYVQQIYSKANFKTILSTNVISPTTSVFNFGEIKSIFNAPLVTAIAGRDKSGKALSVIVINRDMRNSHTVRMIINDIKPIKKVELTSMRATLTEGVDHFVMKSTIEQPSVLNTLEIPPGSISLYKISN